MFKLTKMTERVYMCSIMCGKSSKFYMRQSFMRLVSFTNFFDFPIIDLFFYLV